MHTLPARVAEVVRCYPGRDAFVDGGRRIDYGRFWSATRAFADALRSRGLAAGERVAIVLPNRIEAAVAVYGTWLAGGIAVPLNAHARSRDLDPWLRHCDARHVVHEAGNLDVLATLNGMHTPPVGWVLQPASALPEAMTTDGDAPWHDVDPAADALILYTSGTTGAPKGVTLTHANLDANVTAVLDYLALSPQDRTLGLLPFYYAYGASVLHTHLVSGACVVIVDSMLFPPSLVALAAEERITGLSGVPSTFALLLERGSLGDHDLSTLRYLTQAGGAMTPTLANRLRAALPQADLFVMYGQTEATSRLTWLPPERLDDKPGSVGIPVRGVSMRLLREDGQPAAPGEEGEVCVRGANVMRGYWNADDATRQALRDGWLHTGDIGHMDMEGFLFLSGRRSDMIKTGAHRVHPLDIEEVLAEIPGVRESAVVGIEDDTLGQVVKAFVVTSAGAGGHDAPPSAMAIKAHCRERLPAYKIPRVVEFIDTLPRTASGKVRRAALLLPQAALT